MERGEYRREQVLRTFKVDALSGVFGVVRSPTLFWLEKVNKSLYHCFSLNDRMSFFLP